MKNIVLAIAAIATTAALQAATHVVKVNADGSFSPSAVQIASGDTVEWQFSGSSGSVIPISWDGVSSGYCSAIKPYDPNDFAGPMPLAASGIFTISPLDTGYVIETTQSSCSNGAPPKVTVGSEMLCRGGLPQATMDATWQDPSLSGVFIRLLWSDIQKAPGTADSSFDFTNLDREVTNAVRNGKVYSLGIKAGDDGTPSWLFTNGVTALQLQDSGSDGSDPSCGSRMTLGSPTEIAYQNHFFDLLRKVAAHLKSRADWYRALAYVKLSGANLFTHENRLPKRCESSCICNTQVFALHGYTPSGLYAFYTAQASLLASEFPNKTMSYALIQDGFPRVSDSGAYEKSDGTSSGGPLPSATEETQKILDNGQSAYGSLWAVQHNGLSTKKTDGCLSDVNAQGCPNKWVLQEGLEGQVTGWQTTNEEKVTNASDVDSALQNGYANSQAVFVELYEERYWEAVRQPGGVISPQGSGKTMAQWSSDYRARRLTRFPAIPDPLPLVYRHTFTSSTNQTLYYVEGAKCGIGNATPGAIVIQVSSAPSRRRAAKH